MYSIRKISLGSDNALKFVKEIECIGFMKKDSSIEQQKKKIDEFWVQIAAFLNTLYFFLLHYILINCGICL